ncbi:ankyrin repeat-containing protein [Ilyonectria destructans]|nr:ankyrin repeat-containing protein [Ilyonectria destructans]
MSGAEAGLVIGLISGIISIVEATWTIYSDIKDTKCLPRTFHQTAETLPLVEDTLRIAQGYIDKLESTEESCKAMKRILEGCKTKTEKLQKIFGEIAPQPDDSRFASYRKVARALGKGSRVEALMDGVLRDVTALVQNHGIKTVTDESLGKMAKAIEDLSALPPSLEPEDEPSHISHYGSGDIHHAGGDIIHGNHNEYHGSGTAHFGNVIHNDLTMDDRKTMLLGRLFTSPYEDRKNRNPPRVEGTCEWFTSHPHFRHWQEKEDSAFLWVSADPGCGKSVLARYLVDEKLQSTTAPKTICYFFFKDDFDDQRSPESALCCIIRQIFIQRPELLTEDIVKVFQEGGETIFSSFSSLWGILIGSTSGHSPGEIVCILDALDECEHIGRRVLMKALNTLYVTSAKKSGLRFLVTSRPYANIEKEFQTLKKECPTIHLSGEHETVVDQISTEIDHVIKQRVKELGAEIQLQAEEVKMVEEELTANANRTYLWVYLIFDAINKSLHFTRNGLAATIHNLPKSVNEAYHNILSKSCDVDTTRKILHIIAAAERPLSLQEMAVALALEESHRSHSDLDPELEAEDRFKKRIRDVCGLFVAIVDSKVYLFHQTAREFLIQTTSPNAFGDVRLALQWQNSFSPMESNRILSEICIRYLSFADFENASAARKGHVFFHYAAQNWTGHFRAAKTKNREEIVLSALMLCAASERRLNWLRAHESALGYSDGMTRAISALIIASYFGLDSLVARLAEMKGVSITSQDHKWKRSALSWASQGGHTSVVSLLLKKRPRFQTALLNWINLPISVNSKDAQGYTPLCHAVFGGHKAVVELLLENNAHICEDKNRRTPLSNAAERGYLDITRLLLDRGAGRNGNDRWPLLMAANNGHLDIVRLFLDRGADSNGSDRSPLSTAASNGHLDIVRLLLDKGADGSKSSLIEAAANGRPGVVRLFLDRGDYSNEFKGRLLSEAAKNGHLDVVRLLLDRGADCSGYAGFPLSRAAQKGHVDIVRLLLERGAD